MAVSSLPAAGGSYIGGCWARAEFLLADAVAEERSRSRPAEHLGHEKHSPAASETGNVRNGIRAKTVLTEGSGQVGIEVPRDRDGTFEPQIVPKRLS